MKRIHFFENLFYITILLVALCFPFFTDIFERGGWSELLKTNVRILPFVLIFLIHNYLLAPRLLFADKYLYYFMSCILSVIAVVYFSNLFSDLIYSMQPPFDRMTPPNFPQGNMPPPDAMPFPRGQMPPPDSFSFPRREMPMPPRRGFPFVPHQLFFNFGQAVVSFLLIGFNVGVKVFIRWIEDRERQSERERQYLHTELAFLKHQISPHFFMNTLNNIHSLIDIDTEKARDAVVKLSRLMRYMLYEADVQTVLLKKEIEFIESYIELMRLRYNEDNLIIETKFPDNMEAVYVPSSLFLSFVENAFKHGVHPHNRSLITIHFSIDCGWLTFRVLNYLWDTKTGQTESTGIGLENVRKRLNLIYKNEYLLDIHPSDNFYTVILKIPVS